MKTKGSVLGGGLLIGGTCIGAGMLGLPVITAAAGFYPTMGAFLLVWFFMTLSALAYLEVSLRFKGEVNLISIVEATLGAIPKWFAWVIYVLFLYALMAAYSSGGMTMYASFLEFDSGLIIENCLMGLLFVIPFAWIVYSGTSMVDHINRILMLGLILSFAFLCMTFLSTSHTNHFNPVGDAKYLLFAFPLMVTSFGYHTLIPTLKTYLNEDVKKLRITIFLGGLSPLVIYGIWELIILYLLPTWGSGGLIEILHHPNLNPPEAMAQALQVHGNLINVIISWFSYFALTSSFIGVGLGIRDFFADGLHIKKTKKGRLILTFLTFGPPFIYTILFPKGFLYALNYAGVFAAILLIIFPGLMAWRARVKNIHGKYKMRGGKPVFLLVVVFGLLVVLTALLRIMDVLPLP